MKSSLDYPRFHPIIWLLLFACLTLAILYVWSNSSDRYHRSIIESAGFDPKQNFNHVWTDYTEVGFDFSTEVCLEIVDRSTSIKKWQYQGKASARDAKVLQLASSFSKGKYCVGSNSQHLILNSHWHDVNPYSWEVIFLDPKSNRLLLAAGTL